jgi:N-acetyl-anhydromuramyl-L-alanine amidase AmpD
MGLRTFTLIAAPLGDMAPGRPIDWDQLAPDARAWAEEQAANDNEMLTVLDGDQRAALGAGYDVYVFEVG